MTRINSVDHHVIFFQGQKNAVKINILNIAMKLFKTHSKVLK